MDLEGCSQVHLLVVYDHAAYSPNSMDTGTEVPIHLKKRLHLSQIYRLLSRLHSELPYRLDPTGRAFPPWHYFFEVTRGCNLRCRMCQFRDWFARHTGTDSIEGELTTDEWKQMIDQTSWFSFITFTGGEPWVRRDFDDILEYASRKRRVHVITNGLLLHEERAARCIEMAPRRLGGKGLSFIGVSIDGIENVHNEIRGRADAFETTTRNLRYLTELRDKSRKSCPRLHVTTVIQEHNLSCLPDMPKIAAAIGADVLNLTMEVRFPEIEGLGETDPESFCPHDLGLPQIARARLDKALTLTQESADTVGIELRMPDMPRTHVLQYHDGGLDLGYYTCRSPWTNLMVGAQGNVYPCLIWKVGDAHNQTLRSIWNGPQMRLFRKRLRKNLFCVCQGCCHLEYKSGHYTPMTHHHDDSTVNMEEQDDH